MQGFSLAMDLNGWLTRCPYDRRATLAPSVVYEVAEDAAPSVDTRIGFHVDRDNSSPEAMEFQDLSGLQGPQRVFVTGE